MTAFLALRIAMAFIVGLILAACDAPATGRIIDGWVIGPLERCDVDHECRDYPAVALDGLDERDPGHAAVFRTTLYRQGMWQDGVARTDVLTFCSGGCPWVAVFELADGSVRAIGVGTPGISTVPMSFEYGPAPTPQ